MKKQKYVRALCRSGRWRQLRGWGARRADRRFCPRHRNRVHHQLSPRNSSEQGLGRAPQPEARRHPEPNKKTPFRAFKGATTTLAGARNEIVKRNQAILRSAEYQILFIHGKEDKGPPFWESVAEVKFARNSRAALILHKCGGHGANRRNLKTVNAAITEFAWSGGAVLERKPRSSRMIAGYSEKQKSEQSSPNEPPSNRHTCGGPRAYSVSGYIPDHQQRKPSAKARHAGQPVRVLEWTRSSATSKTARVWTH